MISNNGRKYLNSKGVKNICFLFGIFFFFFCFSNYLILNSAINRKKISLNYAHKQTLKWEKLQEKMLLNPFEAQKMIVFVKSRILSPQLSLRVQEL